MQSYESTIENVHTTTPGAFITSQPSTPDGTLEVERFPREEFSFLPHIIQILEKVETGKNEQEIKNMTRKLKEKFRKCQQILHELPGADLSREEQEQILRQEKQLLDQKRAARHKYLELPIMSNKVNENDGDSVNTIQEETTMDTREG
ncbi:16882_t:CDS:2 [Acaulospora morrowiae]|uniref:Mediator of RNA polymerase II transcription subunit 9 n=1 Tax=Acaulospora morrowiae TaxID=94023 RepID=A0A9N9DM24_9GLOM|nr:16882_t:CDS:2 [Acaulospora morrowiae]